MVTKLEGKYPENKAETTWESELHVDKICCNRVVFSIVKQTFGHYCGYVRFPQKFLKETGYGGIATYVPVHGGITYARKESEGIVYGFDCCHAGDEHNPDTQNIAWLKSECERMATGLLYASKYEERYLEANSKNKAKVLDEFHKELKEKQNIDFNIKDNFGCMINLLCGEL